MTDLGSKNGTFLGTASGDRRIAQHLLRDGETLHLGKVTISFHRGKLVGYQNWQTRKRPLDPTDACSDTVSGMSFTRPTRLVHLHRTPPVPLPHPRDPSAYANDGVHDMVNELVSSSWDSIYATASQKPKAERPPPRPIVGKSPAVKPGPEPVQVIVVAKQKIRVGPVDISRRGARLPFASRPLKIAVMFAVLGQGVALFAVHFVARGFRP